MEPQTDYSFWDRVKIPFIYIILRLFLIIVDIVGLLLITLAWIPMIVWKKQFYTNYIHILKTHRNGTYPGKK